MSSDENIKPITYLKTNPAGLISDVQRSKKPVIITQSGKAKVVVQDIGEYQKQKDLLLLLKTIAMGESDIKKKRLIQQNKLFSSIEKMLDSGQ